MSFTPEDLVHLTGLVAETWRTGAHGDWSVPAGTLDWSCTRTADHAVDTVLARAFFLASGNQHRYPAFEPFTLGADARPDALVEGLQTATRILLAVVAAANPADRAII